LLLVLSGTERRNTSDIVARAWKRLAPEKITRSSMPCLFLDQFSLAPSLDESDEAHAHPVLTKATAVLQEAIRAREMLRGASMNQVLAILTAVRCHMLRTGGTLTVALALVGASAASAQDLCFRSGTGGSTHVAKQFGGVPNANQCKPLQFAEVGAPGASLGGAATGSLCRDAFGDTFILHYTYHSCHTRSYFETATCRFNALHDLPTSGTCRGTADQTPFVDPTVILEACNVNIPGGLADQCGQ
jgi:hypothetical protein